MITQHTFIAFAGNFTYIYIKPTVGSHITNSYIYITVFSIVLEFDHTCMHIQQSLMQIRSI